MKILLLTLIMVLELSIVNAQQISMPKEDLIDFEDTAKIRKYIILDTNQDNLWRIGKPNKSIIHTAYSGENAMMTGLNKPYTSNNKSSFILKFFPSNEIHEDGLACIFGYYKFDSDYLIDTGIVECSTNKGMLWESIMPSAGWSYIWGRGIQDSTDKKPMFSGNVTDRWHQFSLNVTDIAIYAWDSAYFRFTFYSDSIDNSKEGWIIDDLKLLYYPPGSVGNVKENIKFSVFPNPANNSETINIFCKDPNIENLIIYNTFGENLFEKEKPDASTKLNCNIFKKGIYLIQLCDSKGYSATKKIIIF
jgi:hypothetical protein